MHPFVRQIADAVDRHSLLRSDGSPVVVGLSGGADSVALLAALRTLGYSCVAAHCHFGLRGAESDRDRDHACDVALRLGARWEETRFDTRAYCRDNGIGLEDGCRRLRYGWFRQIAADTGAQAVAVAHHRDDQAETFFLNLLRSAGPSGLRGMQPRSGFVVRPMLGVAHADVLRFLADEGLTYVTDSSNLSDDFTRNRIRHNVIPALRGVSGVDADRAVVRSMAHIGECAALLDSLVAARARRYAVAGGGWDVAAIVSGEEMPEAFLYALLAPSGFRRDVTDAVIASARGAGSRRFGDCAGGSWILHSGVLRRAVAASGMSWHASSLRDLPLDVRELPRSEFHPARDASVLWLDSDVCGTPHRWELRPWRQGDRLQPFGMSGTRLVSDILSDAHVAADDKERVMVLTCDGVLLWVIGFRTSRHHIVGAATRDVLRVRVASSM